MAQVDKEVTVNVSIEPIFDYIVDPSNWPDFWPGLLEVKDIQPLPHGCYRAQWLYKMMGMRFKGTAESYQILPYQTIAVETKSSIKSTIVWTFRSLGKKTRVTLTIKYKIPIPLLGRWAEAVIVGTNEQEGDAIMAYLRARFAVSFR